jgi:hypothetical protein
MFYDADHPDVSLSDWQTFLRECPSDLIVELIDRSEIGLPHWFVPFARGVAIASDALLHRAGYRPGMSRPRGWRKIYCDVFDLDIADGLQLTVRQCNNQGLWMVEQFSESRPYACSDEVLVHECGSTPIFTRSYQSAMRLAMYCHANGPPAGLRWIAAAPKDYQVAVEIARKRSIDEAVACRNAQQEDFLRGRPDRDPPSISRQPGN